MDKKIKIGVWIGIFFLVSIFVIDKVSSTTLCSAQCIPANCQEPACIPTYTYSGISWSWNYPTTTGTGVCAGLPLCRSPPSGCYSPSYLTNTYVTPCYYYDQNGGCSQSYQPMYLSCIYGYTPSGCTFNPNVTCNSYSQGGVTYANMVACLSHGCNWGAGSVQPACGDGSVDTIDLPTGPWLEECDNGVANSNSGSCTQTCHNAVCGDGLVWNDQGGTEKCDGLNLNGNDCTTVGGGFTTGTLGCTSGCTFDTSGCSGGAPICGNGVQEVGEQCDNGGSNTNTQCIPSGSPCTYCDLNCSLHTISPGASCGNGAVETGEDCDLGSNNGKELGCTSGCKFDCAHYNAKPYASTSFFVVKNFGNTCYSQMCTDNASGAYLAPITKVSVTTPCDTSGNNNNYCYGTCSRVNESDCNSGDNNYCAGTCTLTDPCSGGGGGGTGGASGAPLSIQYHDFTNVESFGASPIYNTVYLAGSTSGGGGGPLTCPTYVCSSKVAVCTGTSYTSAHSGIIFTKTSFGVPYNKYYRCGASDGVCPNDFASDNQCGVTLGICGSTVDPDCAAVSNSTCKIISTSLVPSSGCSGNTCKGGDTLQVTITYAGDCTAADFAQMDAFTNDRSCVIQYNNAISPGMQGINKSGVVFN